MTKRQIKQIKVKQAISNRRYNECKHAIEKHGMISAAQCDRMRVEHERKESLKRTNHFARTAGRRSRHWNG